MLKHVQMSPLRSSLARSGQKADTLSITSTMSFSSLHEPALSSRSSSYTSLNETQSSTGSASVPATPTTTLRLYTRCVRADLEYKTMCVKYTTTCRDVVHQLLTKYRMTHRDPNLFYLTLEVATKSTGASVRTILVLDDDSCPAQLQACYPRADSRFTIRCRQGGLVKVYDNILMAGSLYKSLLISQRTTVQELIQLLLNCYSSAEKAAGYSLYEVCRTLNYERKLPEDDCPLVVQREWSSPSDCCFVLRKRLALTPRTGREFPPRRLSVRWSRSRSRERPRPAEARQPRSLRALPPLSVTTDSDGDDVFFI